MRFSGFVKFVLK